MVFFLCVFVCDSDSDSDSELSVDEHSSSYASSRSSDSEEEERSSKPKWNNERSPIHSTPKGTNGLFFIFFFLVLKDLSSKHHQFYFHNCLFLISCLLIDVEKKNHIYHFTLEILALLRFLCWN